MTIKDTETSKKLQVYLTIKLFLGCFPRLFISLVRIFLINILSAIAVFDETSGDLVMKFSSCFLNRFGFFWLRFDRMSENPHEVLKIFTLDAERRISACRRFLYDKPISFKTPLVLLTNIYGTKITWYGYLGSQWKEFSNSRKIRMNIPQYCLKNVKILIFFFGDPKHFCGKLAA